MHGNGFERTRSSPRVSPRVVRLLAGDALDMVAPLGSAMPIARVRRRAAVAPGEGESPGPLRTLPVTALAHAPGVAVLIRFTLPCAGTLDVGALSQRLAELTVPSALLDALVRALRVAQMDRAGGGLRWAASDAEGCGGLVHGAALAAVARDALPDALGPAVAGCVRLGLAEAQAREEWSGRLRSGLAHHPRRVLLMRGEALAVSMDVASGAAHLSREDADEAVPGRARAPRCRPRARIARRGATPLRHLLGRARARARPRGARLAAPRAVAARPAAEVAHGTSHRRRPRRVPRRGAAPSRRARRRRGLPSRPHGGGEAFDDDITEEVNPMMDSNDSTSTCTRSPFVLPG